MNDRSWAFCVVHGLFVFPIHCPLPTTHCLTDLHEFSEFGSIRPIVRLYSDSVTISCLSCGEFRRELGMTFGSGSMQQRRVCWTDGMTRALSMTMVRTRVPE